MMRAPAFWNHSSSPLSFLLGPIALLYRLITLFLRSRQHARRVNVPVVCVGNLVAGGAGKTPVAMGVAHLAASHFSDVHFLSRGYGRTTRGVMHVDRHSHQVTDVGDEALLLADLFPSWVANDRYEGAVRACDAGARIIIMDDGFQNQQLTKDLHILVIDGRYGFGNGKLIPAGPLREPVEKGLARADMVVLLGEDTAGVIARLPESLPVVRAQIAPDASIDVVRGKNVIAFAGIGRPQKFFHMLTAAGVKLVHTRSFADHHPYHSRELEALVEKAEHMDALLATTSKDYVRIADMYKDRIVCIDVQVEFDDAGELTTALERLAHA